MNKINIAEAFSTFSDAWSPRVGGDINDMQIKFAKFRGTFDWHQHDQEDELFLVVRGEMRMSFRGGHVDVGEGEYIIVPRRTEHRPEALSEECHVLLLEPASTLNTGSVENERTIKALKRLSSS